MLIAIYKKKRAAIILFEMYIRKLEAPLGHAQKTIKRHLGRSTGFSIYDVLYGWWGIKSQASKWVRQVVCDVWPWKKRVRVKHRWKDLQRTTPVRSTPYQQDNQWTAPRPRERTIYVSSLVLAHRPRSRR